MDPLAIVPLPHLSQRTTRRLAFFFGPLCAATLGGCGSSGDPPQSPGIDAADEAPWDGAVEAEPPPEASLEATTVTPTLAICSPDHWCWDQPKPQGNDLLAIWGSDATHLVAVGELGSLLQFDGSRWTIAAWGAKDSFRAVWGSGPSDVWGVGDAGTLAHFDGTSWTSGVYPAGDAAAPDASSKPKLFGISGTDPTNVWAVGEGGTILHFDGAVWSNPPSGTIATLRAVSADNDDAWAVGDGGVVVHFDGTSWAVDGKAGHTFALSAVGASSSGDVWVAGANGAVAHFDGMNWTSTVLEAGVALRSIVVESSDSVWAAGDGGSVWHLATVTQPEGGLPEAGDAATARKDATSDMVQYAWSKVATGTKANLWGAWRGATGDPWFVGGSGEMLHWIGDAWDRVGSASAANRLAIAGTSANDVWIVGDETLHNSGSGWVPVNAGTDRALYGLTLTDAKGGWGVGTGGTIVHIGESDSDASAAIDSPTTKWLRAAWTSGGSAGWIVGGSGTALALLNGTAWQPVSTGGVAVDLLDVWGSAVNDVWAVGGGGTILHWRGTSWALIPNGADGGTTNELRAVWGSGAKDVWAVGTGGTILHYNGAAWSAAASGETYSLNDIWGSGPADVWAVGTGGTILHWDGATWTAEQSGTNSSLNAVWGSGANDIYAIGESGTILRHQL